MGVLDWLKGAVTTVGHGLGQGISWLHQNVGQPLANFLSKVPIIGDTVKAAQPLLDLDAKIGDALQGNGNGISADDIGNAIDAVPDVISKGAAAAKQIVGLSNRAKSAYASAQSTIQAY